MKTYYIKWGHYFLYIQYWNVIIHYRPSLVARQSNHVQNMLMFIYREIMIQKYAIVLIVYCNSKISAHVFSKIGNLI